ncbi:hypothetical protein [uncultured Hymenobacter sp.]|uniref:hypothetical protein n=1 Tax=uncultured Hymenobacter sp. TaxID=170016 RepID=UPI0035CC2C82
MKSFFLPLLTAAALLTATSGAQAQDKPVLNTTPPGSRPAPQPAPAPQPPQPATPQPEPATVPTPPSAPEAPVAPAPAPANVPAPTPDSPSGLNFPGRGRTKHTEGFGGPALTAKKYFIYTNFGLGFNSFDGLSQFNVSVAPALGYRVTDRLSVGPGISYSYGRMSLTDNVPANIAFPNGERAVSTSSLGFKAFAQFMVYKQFFLHGEYEVTNAELVNARYEVFKRNVRTPLLGAGYRTEFSSNAAADIVVLYNFNSGVGTSIYGQPEIRFNFLFNIGR